MRLIFVLHVYVNVALHGAAAYFTAGGLHICASRSLNVLVALHGLAGLLRGGRRKGSRGRASCSPSLLQVLCFTTPLLITFGLLRQTSSIE